MAPPNSGQKRDQALAPLLPDRDSVETAALRHGSVCPDCATAAVLGSDARPARPDGHHW